MVGLGNPGPRYADTRHNAGFRIVERLADVHGIELGEERFAGRFGAGRIGAVEVGLLEPQTFMNRSGASVVAAVDALSLAPAEDLLVAIDELDLPLGRIRLRPSGGAGGHRGLADVIDALGRDDFARLRFGLGRPPPEVDPVDYVLEPFPEAQVGWVVGRIGEAARAVECAIADGVVAAMNRFNREPDDEPVD